MLNVRFAICIAYHTNSEHFSVDIINNTTSTTPAKWGEKLIRRKVYIKNNQGGEQMKLSQSKTRIQRRMFVAFARMFVVEDDGDKKQNSTTARWKRNEHTRSSLENSRRKPESAKTSPANARRKPESRSKTENQRKKSQGSPENRSRNKKLRRNVMNLPEFQKLRRQTHKESPKVQKLPAKTLDQTLELLSLSFDAANGTIEFFWWMADEEWSTGWEGWRQVEVEEERRNEEGWEGRRFEGGERKEKKAEIMQVPKP